MRQMLADLMDPMSIILEELKETREKINDITRVLSPTVSSPANDRDARRYAAGGQGRRLPAVPFWPPSVNSHRPVVGSVALCHRRLPRAAALLPMSAAFGLFRFWSKTNFDFPK
ncbi:unnamed protein product [Cuscuta epithymum]|uniref:Uncharacterized protein n=1 Tax=Cuscuta epithymum TaxID=186058 RepID=A0AAV0FKW2_9ASTE|nr:unnamed protein product [Cuscuta epithymum]